MYLKKTQGEDVECCIYTIIVLDQLGAHSTTPAIALTEFTIYNLVYQYLVIMIPGVIL